MTLFKTLDMTSVKDISHHLFAIKYFLMNQHTFTKFPEKSSHHSRLSNHHTNCTDWYGDLSGYLTSLGYKHVSYYSVIIYQNKIWLLIIILINMSNIIKLLSFPLLLKYENQLKNDISRYILKRFHRNLNSSFRFVCQFPV